VLRVIVRQARSGMRLARSVINPRHPDQTLLPAGHELDTRTIARLHELGVYDLWIDYPGLEFLDDLYSPELSAKQQRLCQMLQDTLIEQVQRSGAPLPVGQYRATVEDLVHGILNSATTLPFVSALAGVDDALLRHSCEVCVLSVMLGLRLESYVMDQRKRVAGKDARDVVNLGMGALLHDVGELQMPAEQRESHRGLAFDAEAGEQWKAHVELGYHVVHGQLEPSAATVVLHHHQHFDGSGFPNVGGTVLAQRGSQIHVFSRIAAAADTFVHLLHRDGIPQPTVYALWQIQQEPMRKWFDPVVLEALLEVVPPFLPGMVVTLSDRRHAVVTKVHPTAPCYPEVQVLSEQELMGHEMPEEAREIIDLAVAPEFYVAAVDGFEVEKFLYGSRHAEEVGFAVPRETTAVHA
jgi:HD-GYP domain-containing protein (c-di-GMP phosphodiesterase class II)